MALVYINDIYTANESVFDTDSIYPLGEWFDSDFRKAIEGRLNDLFGSRELFHDKLDRIQYSVQWLIISNKYKYETLYATTVAQYNPMENYDMTEHTVVAGEADQGEQTNTGSDATDVFAFDSGADGVDNSKGNTSDTIGSRHDESKTTTDINRHGNIGVLSGQDLIKLSRSIADFSIIDIMALDIAHCISLALY